MSPGHSESVALEGLRSSQYSDLNMKSKGSSSNNYLFRAGASILSGSNGYSSNSFINL